MLSGFGIVPAISTASPLRAAIVSRLSEDEYMARHMIASGWRPSDFLAITLPNIWMSPDIVGSFVDHICEGDYGEPPGLDQCSALQISLFLVSHSIQRLHPDTVFLRKLLERM